ncbi:MFS transporter [Methylorubrum podarium]|uniref:MFS transporter n=1 Tax=Methylorubrum podarium TaxID=200476 RepID=UPI00279533BF|nr:MFS transporter [Methylorubrum podarium]
MTFMLHSGTSVAERMSSRRGSDVRRVLWARALRAFGDGYVAILLPVHLAALGFNAITVGLISTATLLGSVLLTLGFGFVAHRMKRRSALLAASILMAATGLGFLALDGFWPLALIAFVGTLNPSSGDVSVFLPLEHTVLTASVSDRERTSTFARYSFVGSVIAAVGALAAGVVDWLSPLIDREAIIQGLFLLYGALGLASFLLYRGLSPSAEKGASRQRMSLGRPAAVCSGLPPCLRSTPSAVASSSTRCSPYGCSSALGSTLQPQE